MELMTKEDFTKESLKALHESLGLPEEFYFVAEELDCPHCGELKLSTKVYVVLMKLRLRLKEPVVITSGYRCPEYNRRIGGVPKSAHTKGLAVDIRIPTSGYRFRILEFLVRETPRIGVAEDFIHFDLDYSKPFPVVWTYGSRRHLA